MDKLRNDRIVVLKPKEKLRMQHFLYLTWPAAPGNLFGTSGRPTMLPWPWISLAHAIILADISTALIQAAT